MKDLRTTQQKWRGLLVATLAVLLGASCGGAMQQATPSTSSSGTTKAASLSLNESSLDFGNVQVGSSKSNALTLTNSSATGGPNVTFSQVASNWGRFCRDHGNTAHRSNAWAIYDHHDCICS